MEVVALALIAQAAAPIDPSVYERLGTAGVVAVVLGACIWWLVKDRARVISQRDTLFSQVVEAEQRTDTILAQITPILEATNQELRLARERSQ